MAEKRDYYEVLGVAKDADDAAIKKAYREIAKKYHPDINPSAEAAEIFKEASEAYSVLSDKEKRAQYDQFGHAAFDGSGGGYGGGFSGFSGDMGDIFGDIFGDLFGGGRSRRNDGPMKGANLRTAVRITFDESVKGCEKELKLNLKDPCPTCHGSGAKPGTSPITCPKCQGRGQITITQQSMFGMVRNVQVCPDCHGSGKIIKDKCPDCRGTGYQTKLKNIQVTIPAGIDNGQSIRIRGKGEPGINGGEWGDLLVEVAVSQHPIFRRQDYDIFSQTVPVSFCTGSAWCKRLELIQLMVRWSMSLKQELRLIRRYVLRGKGVPSLRNKKCTRDHYVTFVVQVPTSMTKEQKEALKAFDEAMNGKTTANTTTTKKKHPIKDFFEKDKDK